MCTLTIYSGKKRCVVTMNRDELRTRKEAGVIHSRSQGEVRLFYPVDISSSGTWFGVNNHAVVLAILNRYQGQEQRDAVSRGHIIPEALGQGGFHAVDAWLQKFNARAFNPFDLFLVGKHKVRHYTWDGTGWSVTVPEFKHWYMFTSSYIRSEDVIAFRQNFFDAWSKEVGKKLIEADEVLRGFHLIQIEGLESRSVLMERERSHTKSVIQADIHGGELVLKYFPDVLEKALTDVRTERISLRKAPAA